MGSDDQNACSIYAERDNGDNESSHDEQQHTKERRNGPVTELAVFRAVGPLNLARPTVVFTEYSWLLGLGGRDFNILKVVAVTWGKRSDVLGRDSGGGSSRRRVHSEQHWCILVIHGILAAV
jgi:hypothetical protein